MKCVICINDTKAKMSLTNGKTYFVLEEVEDVKYKIMNDNLEIRWYGANRFENIEDIEMDKGTQCKLIASNYKLLIPLLKECLIGLEVPGLKYDNLEIKFIDKEEKEEDPEDKVQRILKRISEHFVKEETELQGKEITYCNLMAGEDKNVAIFITKDKKIMLFNSDEELKYNDVTCNLLYGEIEIRELFNQDKSIMDLLIKYDVMSKEEKDFIIKEGW